MAAASDKAAGAFRTIGELSRETGLPQHILRYWETRFPQLRPLQRAGNRRYYRPEDVALVLRINAMLNQEGYTIRGVQKLLSTERKRATPAVDLGALQAVRDQLARALAEHSG
jgi:DNA-binding transcriptional MerR regulator